MSGGLAEVGARLVLAGKEAYIAGMREAAVSQKELAAQTKATAESEKGASASAKALIDAKMKLAEANRQAAAADREYQAAVTAQSRAEAEAAAVDDEALKKKALLAKARTDAALAAKTASAEEVAAAKASAAAASAAADKEVAAQERVKESSKLLSSTAKTMFFGVAAAAGVTTVASVKMAADFQTLTTKLITSGSETNQTIAATRQGMLDLAGTVGVSATQLAADIYPISGASYQAQAALGALKAAEEGAKAEGADGITTAKALTEALRDYYPAAKSAADVTKASALVMSQFEATSASGQLSLQEMSSALHTVAPFAAALKIPMSDLLGSLASMTVHGVTAQQATQNMANAMRQFINPTKDMRTELAGLNINAAELSDSLSKNGLYGTIENISTAILKNMGPDGKMMLNAFNTSKIAAQDAQIAFNAMGTGAQNLAKQFMAGKIGLTDFRKEANALGGNQDNLALQWAALQDQASGFNSILKGGGQDVQNYVQALQKATGSANGFQTAMLITGENAEYTADAIKKIAGAVPEASGDVRGWSDIQQNFNQKLKETEAGLQSAGISIGTALLPSLGKVLGVVGQVAGVFERHTGAVKNAIVVIGILTGLYVTYAATVKVVTLVEAAWNVMNTILTKGLWSEDLALVANPIGLVVVAIVALAGALIYAYFHWTAFRNVVNSVASTVKDVVVGAWHVVAGVTRDVWGSVSGFVKSAWDRIMTFARWAIAGIVGYFAPMVQDIRSHWDEIVEVARFVWDTIKFLTAPLIGFIKFEFFGMIDVIKLALAIVVGILRLAWNVIWTATKVAWDMISGSVKVAWDIIVMMFKVARDLIMGIIVVFLDLVTGHWSRAWTDIKDFGGRIWHDISDGVAKIFGDMWHTLKNIFGDLWQGTKDIFSGLWTDLKHIFTAGANVVIDVVNGFLKIVNNIAGAVGFSINLHVDHVPELAEGGVIPVRYMATGGALDFSEVGSGFVTNRPRAIVGEGGSHPEYVIPTDPKHRGRALGLFADLAQYLMGSLPGFDAGGVLGSVWGGITSAAGAVGGAVKSAADWAGDVAASGLRAVIEKAWPALQVPAGLVGLIPSVLNTLRQHALDFLGAQYVPAGAGGGMAAAPAQVAAWIVQALDLMGKSHAFEPGMASLIMHESGGNPNAINLYDSNAAAGHPSQGLTQTIPSTYRAYVLPSLANRPITDPVANITAGFRYAEANYGDAMIMAGGRHDASGHYLGYESGGVIGLAARLGIPTRNIGGAIASGQPYLVGESGPEIVVPAAPGLVIPQVGNRQSGQSSTTSTSTSFGGTTVNLGPVTIYESGDPKRTYEALRRGVSDALARR